MTIDIARGSFDISRGWRAVLPQQGRVTLEADGNEQVAIATQALLDETVDIIGPVGTPDGGYVVSVSGGNVEVSAGTIYVGGWRLSLPKPVLITRQPGWLDMPPLFEAKGNEIVAVLAIEQSVVAVEDQALREVALGGPDSAGRLALLQHFLRISSGAGSCAAAATSLNTIFADRGLSYDPKSCVLASLARLRVEMVEGVQPATPCDPPAQGGYLGADNQMIRVSLTSHDKAAGQGTLVWGWNNASFLFRAKVTADNLLTFLADPLDPDHTPQQGQAVEILRCTEDLGDGEPPHTAAGGNFIAAGDGVVMVLGAAPYASATRQLSLPDKLTFVDAALPVFVRLWHKQINYTDNTKTELGDTGIAVVISDAAIPEIGGRPFWHFAVRPSTPVFVYPQRYLDSPQPPEGPRQFFAQLAVVGGNSDGYSLIEDCSKPFLPLTRLHDCSCCSLVLDPDKDWQTTLNQAIDNEAVTSLSVCFQPGQFEVRKKITITRKTVRMTGAGLGTRITGRGLEAVLEFDNCPGVSLSDFCVAAGTSGYATASGTQGLQGAVTIRSCDMVDIERMLFACADADLRSASCLAIYNAKLVFADEVLQITQQFSARVANSRFEVGNAQVGILLVNADRAQVEGNVIVTKPMRRNMTIDNLPSHKAVAHRLRKQLLHELTVSDTAPPNTKRARARMRRRTAQMAASKATPPATRDRKEETAQTQAAGAAATVQAGEAPLRAPVPEINLGTAGRAHVKASYGTFRLSFISSDKLTNAWVDVLRNSGLNDSSTMGAIHKTVRKIATDIVMKPGGASSAFRNYLAIILPQLYSTSSQGIVVGGDFANDIRILDNTVDGTAQGIHVGLSDVKRLGPHPGHLSAVRVQIRGNTVNVRVTPETTGDRHGIFLGCVQSAVVADNHLQLARTSFANGAGQTVAAIKVAGFFGQFLMVERNNMVGFSVGLYTDQDAAWPPSHVLWKVADNASDAPNQITGGGMFIQTDNIP